MPGDRWETCRSFEQLLSKDYTTGKALAHGFGPDACKPDYSYLKGDITQAYTDKVKEAKRSFVFLNLHAAEVPPHLSYLTKLCLPTPHSRNSGCCTALKNPR